MNATIALYSGAIPIFPSTHYAGVLVALKEDPYNRTRRHPIKKLAGVPPNDGQYRFRSGRFRFRYDIQAQIVFLKACSLRREDSY